MISHRATARRVSSLESAKKQAKVVYVQKAQRSYPGSYELVSVSIRA